MQINDELIEYLEALSKLRLSAEERQSVSAQLQEFLEYAGMIEELDFAAPEDEKSELGAGNALRADLVKPSMPVEAVLQNAPERQGDYFSVPKAIE